MRGRPRSVDRGTYRPGIQPRKSPTPGRRRRGDKRKATSGASISRDATESRAVRDPEHVRTHLARAASIALKRAAAAGVDGETWRHYCEARETHLAHLSERLKRGAYRAKQVQRA